MGNGSSTHPRERPRHSKDHDTPPYCPPQCHDEHGIQNHLQPPYDENGNQDGSTVTIPVWLQKWTQHTGMHTPQMAFLQYGTTKPTQFPSPRAHVYAEWNGEVNIDDTTIWKLAMTGMIQALVLSMCEMAQTWERLLWVSGRGLNLKKCFWYAVSGSGLKPANPVWKWLQWLRTLKSD